MIIICMTVFIIFSTEPPYLLLGGGGDIRRSFLKLGNSEKTVELIIHDTVCTCICKIKFYKSIVN